MWIIIPIANGINDTRIPKKRPIEYNSKMSEYVNVIISITYLPPYLPKYLNSIKPKNIPVKTAIKIIMKIKRVIIEFPYWEELDMLSI